MSWLSKQLKSATKIVTHPKEWAGNALKTAGQGWEAIDDFALPAIGFALGGPAGAALGGAAAGAIGNGRPKVGNIAKGAVTGYLGGGTAAGLGNALSAGGSAIGQGGINYAMGRGAPGAAGGAAASVAGPGAAAGSGGGWGDIASQIGGAAMGSVPGVGLAGALPPGVGGAPGAGGGGISGTIGSIGDWIGQPGNKTKLLETLAYALPAGMSAYQGIKAEGKQNDLLGRQMALGDQTAQIGQGLINEATPLRQTAQQQMLAALTGGAGSVPTPPDLSQFINKRNPFAAQFAAGGAGAPAGQAAMPAAAAGRSRLPRLA